MTTTRRKTGLLWVLPMLLMHVTDGPRVAREVALGTCLRRGTGHLASLKQRVVFRHSPSS
ncbi:MAG: hypothetical protein H8K03_21840 (plasmid) [Nitrospira sp.]